MGKNLWYNWNLLTFEVWDIGFTLKGRMDVQIILCEDCLEDRRTAEQLIRTCAGQVFEDWSLESFGSAEDFRAGIAQKRPDIAFMDIYFGADSGLDLAREIREKSPGTAIVFLTISNEFAAESYAVQAADYILKPARLEEVLGALRRCQQIRRAWPRILTLKKGRDNIQIREAMVNKIEAEGNYLNINTTKGEIRVRKRFKDIAEQLSGNMLLLRRGVIVNMNYIEMIKNNVCWLKNGEEIPLSRKNAGEIRRRYYNYQFNSVREEGL